MSIRRVRQQNSPPTQFIRLARDVYPDPADQRWSLGHSAFPTSDGSTIHRLDIGPLVVQWEVTL